MLAKELIDILHIAPDANVKFESIEYCSENGVPSYNLLNVNGYRVDKNYKGEITNIILSYFDIQPRVPIIKFKENINE